MTTDGNVTTDREVTTGGDVTAGRDLTTGRDGHWWQWVNVLSLDAAAIAVLWYHLLALAVGEGTHLPSMLVMGLSAWLVYMADHWLDARRYRLQSISLREHCELNNARLYSTAGLKAPQMVADKGSSYSRTSCAQGAHPRGFLDGSSESTSLDNVGRTPLNCQKQNRPQGKSLPWLPLRHRVWLSHGKTALTVWLIVLSTDLLLAFNLMSTWQLFKGLLLLVAVIGYLVMVNTAQRWLAKEVVVAALFAIAPYALLPGSHFPELRDALHICLLAGLVYANCCLLNDWEKLNRNAHRKETAGIAAGTALPWPAAVFSLVLVSSIAIWLTGVTATSGPLLLTIGLTAGTSLCLMLALAHNDFDYELKHQSLDSCFLASALIGTICSFNL